MTTYLQIAGLILILLALLHAYFPAYFGWREELQGITLLTRQIFYVHHFFIALTVGLMGVLTTLSADELLATPIGRRVLLGFGVFWFVRLLFQVFVYSPSLWRGKRFETIVHILFLVLWVFLSGVYVIGAIG